MYAITSMLCGCVVASAIWFVVPGHVSAGATPLPQQGQGDRQATGKVLELWVSAPGRVQFRLQGKDEKGKEVTTWFETPADKDTNTLFENLALSTIRHSLESGIELHVQAKDSSGDDGSLPTKAYDIVRIGMRFSN